MPKQLHFHHVDCFNKLQCGFMHNLETTLIAQCSAKQYFTSTDRQKGQQVT
jgi:hypothetical protein